MVVTVRIFKQVINIYVSAENVPIKLLNEVKINS